MSKFSKFFTNIFGGKKEKVSDKENNCKCSDLNLNVNVEEQKNLIIEEKQTEKPKLIKKEIVRKVDNFIPKDNKVNVNKDVNIDVKPKQKKKYNNKKVNINKTK